MGPWGVLQPFCTRNRYLNAFRCNFKKIQNFGFFEIFHLWDPQKWTRRNFCGCRNFDIIFEIGLKHHKDFQKKKPPISRSHFEKNVKNVKKVKKSILVQNMHFLKSVVFVAFVAFFVAKMLLTKKFMFRATFSLLIIFSYLP